MIRAGNLRHRLVLQRPQEAVEASGAVVETWETYATISAEKLALSHEDFLSGAVEGGERRVAFRARWRPDVQVTDRLVQEGATFELVEIIELGWRQGIELRARAVS